MKKFVLLGGLVVIIVLTAISLLVRSGESDLLAQVGTDSRAVAPIAPSIGGASAPNIMSEGYSGYGKESGGLRNDSAAKPQAGAPAPESAGIVDRMIIYNANLSIVVKDVQSAISSVGELTSRLGGSVVGTSTSYQDSKMLANVTIKVPSISYNEAMDGLRRLGIKVERENSSGREVTEEYTDLESQLRNLDATEFQYLELMKKAQTIDEILKVQGRLTEIRGQIERTKGRMSYLQRSSEMATITLSILPEGISKVTPPTPREWDPAGAANEAWEASLEIIRGVALVAIRVAVFSWWLAPPVLLLIFVALRFRGRGGNYQPSQTS